jgi:hypothetical protein
MNSELQRTGRDEYVGQESSLSVYKAKKLKKRIKSQVLYLNCESRVIFRIFDHHCLMRRTKLRSSYMSPAVCMTNMQTVKISKPMFATSRYVLFNFSSEPRTLLYWDTIL